MSEYLDVHFLSAECYPCAKTGGLGDVVGALPKYLTNEECTVTVVLPKYDMEWFQGREFESIFSYSFRMGYEEVWFDVQRYLGDDLGFPLLVIYIPGKFDRYGVYAGRDGIFFKDEVERYAAFQRAYLTYLNHQPYLPGIIHCHDHHVGLIPFMVQQCFEFRDRLSRIPTVFTIHNQRYQGTFSWEKQYLIPQFNTWMSGMLDWADHINPLASAVKMCWAFTTVSPSYMEELKVNSFGLEWLFNNESGKGKGILNGIDAAVWDPSTDGFLAYKLKSSLPKFKLENKAALLKDTYLDPNTPLTVFIGRFALEKGADLLPWIIELSLSRGMNMNFLILGTGEKSVEADVANLALKYPNRVVSYISYNEGLSHQIYAGADFLIMPSRVEPCGLNQMYALKYGTIPVVHDLGGLRDSIDEINGSEGTGFKFRTLYIEAIVDKLWEATHLYEDKDRMTQIRKNAVAEDNSWDSSAEQYMNIYRNLLSPDLLKD